MSKVLLPIMTKEITYKQAELQDEPLIAAFYKEAFNEIADYKYPDRFEWMFKKNPFQKKNGLLPIWLAFDGGRVVGMSTLMYQLFTIKGIKLSGAWCCDLRILPEYRRMGVAGRLEKMRMENEDVFSVSSSDISIKIKEKLDYSAKYAYTSHIFVEKFDPDLIFDDLTRYLRVKKKSNIYNLGYKFKLHRAFSVFLSILYKLLQRTRKKNNKELANDIAIVKIDRFDNRASEFWNEIKSKYGIAALRSSEYLNWKYVSQKNMNYQNYIFSIDNKIVGILVIRKTKNVGIISDVIVTPDGTLFSSLLHFAVTELFRQGSEMIMSCGSNEKQNKFINGFGFIPLEHHQGVFHLTDRNKKLYHLIDDMPWVIGYGDHDIDEPGKKFHPSLKTLIRALYLNSV